MTPKAEVLVVGHGNKSNTVTIKYVCLLSKMLFSPASIIVEKLCT